MRRGPAILIVIFLAAPLFFGAFLTISVSTWALDRGFYTTLLADERLYQIPDESGSWWTKVLPDLDGMGYTGRPPGLRARCSPPPTFAARQSPR